MFLDFKKWVKSIQTAGYNGARTVSEHLTKLFSKKNYLVVKIGNYNKKLGHRSKYANSIFLKHNSEA